MANTYGDTQVLEDEGRIVIDSVARTMSVTLLGNGGRRDRVIRSSHLLADHKSNGNQGSLSVSLDCPHLSLQVPEGCTTDQATLNMSVSFVFGRSSLDRLPHSQAVLSSLRVPSGRMGGLEEGFKIISNHTAERWERLTS